MDNAMCGGGSGTLSGTALAAVKAAIFMGDPKFTAGQSYEVGTCKAKGVSTTSPLKPQLTYSTPFSSKPAAVVAAPRRRRSSLTATRQTHTAATATVLPHIKAMERSMARRL